MNMKIKQRHFIKSSEIKILKDEMLKQYDQKFIESIFPLLKDVTRLPGPEKKIERSHRYGDLA